MACHIRLPQPGVSRHAGPHAPATPALLRSLCGRVVPVKAQVQRAYLVGSQPVNGTCKWPQARSWPRSTTATKAMLDTAVLASTSPVPQDAICCLVAGVLAYIWTKLFDLLVANGFLEKKLSRKVVHITTAPLFMLTWPLFSANPWARVFAAVIPILNGMRLMSVGLGITQDSGLVNSVSRSGDKAELLKGPLYYIIVLLATILVCWREDPTGMIAVCLMSGGDGLADIVGRRWGATNKLPFNPSKSLAGSVAMFVGGTLMAALLVTVYCQLGYYPCYSPGVLLPYLMAVSGVATVVEALPINKVFDDNLSVPLVAALTAMLLMPHAASQTASVLAVM